MKCPSCGVETELTSQDPDCSRSELKGTMAILDVTANQLCDSCFEVVESKVFRLKVTLPEVADHVDPTHTLNIHPSTIKWVEGVHETGVYEIGYDVNCSCGGLAFSQTGIAVLQTYGRKTTS